MGQDHDKRRPSLQEIRERLHTNAKLLGVEPEIIAYRAYTRILKELGRGELTMDEVIEYSRFIAPLIDTTPIKLTIIAYSMIGEEGDITKKEVEERLKIVEELLRQDFQEGQEPEGEISQIN